MILFLGMQLVPLAYGILSLRHSVKRKKRGQAVAFGTLLLLSTAATAALLWEFLAMP